MRKWLFVLQPFFVLSLGSAIAILWGAPWSLSASRVLAFLWVASTTLFLLGALLVIGIVLYRRVRRKVSAAQ